MKTLKIIWNKWKAFAEVIGNIQATVIFSVLYIIIFVPMGVAVGMSKDYLNLKTSPKWTKMRSNSNNLSELREE